MAPLTEEAGKAFGARLAAPGERPRRLALDLRPGRTVAGWTLLAASILVPVGMLILAFPGFYLGSSFPVRAPRPDPRAPPA